MICTIDSWAPALIRRRLSETSIRGPMRRGNLAKPAQSLFDQIVAGSGFHLAGFLGLPRWLHWRRAIRCRHPAGLFIHSFFDLLSIINRMVLPVDRCEARPFARCFVAVFGNLLKLGRRQRLSLRNDCRTGCGRRATNKISIVGSSLDAARRADRSADLRTIGPTCSRNARSRGCVSRPTASSNASHCTAFTSRIKPPVGPPSACMRQN